MASPTITSLNSLPPCKTLDILPPLHALLTRLLPLPSSSAPLDPKDLSTEISALKIRIQKAWAAKAELLDVEWSVAEQKVEIGVLKERAWEMGWGREGGSGGGSIGDQIGKGSVEVSWSTGCIQPLEGRTAWLGKMMGASPEDLINRMEKADAAPVQLRSSVV